MRNVWGMGFAILIAGCSGGDFETGTASEDSSTSDTGSSTSDSTTEDSSSSEDSSTTDSTVTDSGTDTGTVHMDAKPDVVTVDVIATETDMTPCHAFWCGCGVCAPKDITCTKASLGCPLGCASAPCPAAEAAGTCSTVGDRCQRNDIAGDIACYRTADCPPGNCCKGAGSPPTHGVCITGPSPDCGP